MQLLAELRRALSYPRLRERIDPQDATALLDWLTRSGDKHLLALADEFPILPPSRFPELAATRPPL